MVANSMLENFIATNSIATDSNAHNGNHKASTVWIPHKFGFETEIAWKTIIIELCINHAVSATESACNYPPSLHIETMAILPTIVAST